MRVALQLQGSVDEEKWRELSSRLKSRHGKRYCVNDKGEAHWYVFVDGERPQVEEDIRNLAQLGPWQRIDRLPFEECPHAKLMPVVYNSEPLMAYCLARSWQRCRPEACEFCPEFPTFYDPQTVIELEYEGYWSSPQRSSEA